MQGSRRSRAPERWVLAVALVGAAALVAAALAPGNRPESSARARLAQLAGEVEDAVVAEWRRMLRELPERLGIAPDLQFGGGLRATAAPRVAEVEPESAAYRALAADAQSEREPARALELARMALVAARGATARAASRLRFVQAALAAGAPDEAIATWRAAHAGADEGVAVADLDARLALFLALEGGLEPAERVRAAVDLALATSRGVLVLPVAMRPGELDPRVEVVVERIASAAGEERAAVAMLLAASLARLRGETLVRLGQAPARCEGLAWSLAPAGDALLATRAADGGGCAGFRADPDAVRALLVEAAAPVLAAGIVLDVRDDSGLEPLRARHELVPGVLAFTVACADVDAWISRESARARYQSAGLVALAFLCAVAGVVAARALARERALAEARAAFVAGVSHELRTPIASILLLSENLEAGRATPESAARYYGLIRREALRLRQLVDTMLDFSRLERGQELAVAREPVDVAAWFASIADEARAWAATHALDLTVDARDLPASASIDREALRRALWNLLDNARKHSGARRVTLAARGERGALILEVTDAGRGVPRELRARVFEPFTRHAEPGVPGTGLGLALVRGIAGAHGGSIAVADAEGGGARFTLWIPVEEGEIA